MTSGGSVDSSASGSASAADDASTTSLSVQRECSADLGVAVVEDQEVSMARIAET